MNGKRRAVIVAAFVAAAGVGAAYAPVALGQTRVFAKQPTKVFGLLGGGRIGISIRDLEDADAKSMQGVTAGVLIEDVAADSPAEKSGIRKGDVVVEFDGERVRSARQLTRLVQETPPGRSVPAAVIRDGQRTTLTITPTDSGKFSFNRFGIDDLGDFRFNVLPRPPTPPTPPSPPAIWKFDELFNRTTRLGVTVDSLSAQLAEYFGTKQGVLVTSVTDSSPASKAGLKAGDVITSFNGSPVDDPADVRRRVQELRDGDEFTIAVMRDRKPQTLKGKLERMEPVRSYRSII